MKTTIALCEDFSEVQFFFNYVLDYSIMWGCGFHCDSKVINFDPDSYRIYYNDGTQIIFLQKEYLDIRNKNGLYNNARVVEARDMFSLNEENFFQ